MGNGQSAGCRIIDSGRQPDRNSPFVRNSQMLDQIVDNNCSEYTTDILTGQITYQNWAQPLTIDNQNTGTLIPSNVCFSNPDFFGVNSQASYQKSYTVDYCQNISPATDVEFFKQVQDGDFRIFLNGVNPDNVIEALTSPEWGNKELMIDNITKSEYIRSLLLSEGLLFGGAISGSLSFTVVTALRGIRLAVSRGLTSTVSADGSGTVIELQNLGEAEAAEEGEIAETSFGAEGAEAIAEGTAAATVEVAGGTAAETALGTAGVFATGAAVVAVPLILAAIVAGFVPDLTNSNCGYDDQNEPTLVYKGKTKGACCRNSCAIDGTLTKCYRAGSLGFNASLFQCCFQDYNCYKKKNQNADFTVSNENITSQKDLCFNIKQNVGDDKLPKVSTCHPYVRDLNSQYCANVVGAYCTGQTPFGENQESLLDAWSANGVIDFVNENGSSFSVKSPCLNFLARLLTGGTTLGDNICSWEDFVQSNVALTPELLDPVGLTIAQEILDKFLTQYLEVHGSPIGSIDEDGYIESSDFLTWYFNLCKDYPFLCQNSLTNFCKNFTPEELLTKPVSVQWCGCYLQDEYYESYNKFGITKECSPLCNRADNIPLVGDDGVFIPCTDTVCMIDDLTISLVNTFSSGGPIDFSQVCNGCGGSKIVKKFNSNYSWENNTNITQFFELAPLTKDDFNGLTDVAFNSTPNSINYRNNSLVGFFQSTTDYPILENTNYKIVSTSNSANIYTVQFNLGVPIVVPGSVEIINYIASFTDETVETLTKNTIFINNLDPSDFSKNIFKIAIDSTGIVSPLGNLGFFYLKINYFKSGQIKNNNGDTISQSYIQSLLTDVDQYNVGIIGRNCNCTIQGNLDFIDEQIGNLDISNNCGNVDCRDSDGNRIPCATSSVNVDNSNVVDNKVIASVSDNVIGFNLLTQSQKVEFVSSGTVAIFTVLVLANIFLTFYPRKYKVILTSLGFGLIFAFVILYLIYSNSFDMSSYTNIF